MPPPNISGETILALKRTITQQEQQIIALQNDVADIKKFLTSLSLTYTIKESSGLLIVYPPK